MSFPHNLVITTEVRAGAHMRDVDYAHVVSFGDPLTAPPQGYRECRARKLRIECDDIEREPLSEDAWYRAITVDQVRELVDFASGVDGPLLVHCMAGISRSTAAAYVILAHHYGPGRETEALAHMRRVRSQAWPNRRIIGLADEIMGRGGAMVAADLAWRPGIVDRDGIPGYAATRST